MTRRAATAAVLLLFAACPGRLEDPDRFRTCVKNVEVDIFPSKCATAGCHDAVSHQNNLDLASAGVAQRIRTGISTCQSKPLSVHIPEKLTLMPPCGSSMPLGMPLDAPDVACIKQYIARVLDGGSGSGDGGTDGG